MHAMFMVWSQFSSIVFLAARNSPNALPAFQEVLDIDRAGLVLPQNVFAQLLVFFRKDDVVLQ